MFLFFVSSAFIFWDEFFFMFALPIASILALIIIVSIIIRVLVVFFLLLHEEIHFLLLFSFIHSDSLCFVTFILISIFVFGLRDSLNSSCLLWLNKWQCVANNRVRVCVCARDKLVLTVRGQGKRANFQVCEKRTICRQQGNGALNFPHNFGAVVRAKAHVLRWHRISLCMWLECTKRNSLYDEQRAVHNRYISLVFFPFFYIFLFYLVFLSQFTVVGDSVVAFYRLFVSSNSPQFFFSSSFRSSLFVVFSTLFSVECAPFNVYLLVGLQKMWHEDSRLQTHFNLFGINCYFVR